ncbi:MAG TPA: TonB C-terminal domain-containing protein [Kofleriaceae bacterium]|nr:TonB C-terminal domain-containing protein [Kofleriaceae bacterium]
MKIALAIAVLAGACGGAEPAADTGPKKKPPPPRQDTVRDVGPDGEGELPMEQVELNMREVRAAVITCAQETSYEGKVTVRVTIAPTGAASAVIERGSGQAEVDDCVTAAFGKVSFPTSERGQRFQYSFTF